MIAFSRRDLLAGAALAASALSATRSFAAAPFAGMQAPTLYRYKIGSYQLTALSDGIWERPIDDKFVRNAEPAAVRKAMTDAFLPATDKLPIPFTALLVNTGSKLVLIDTGSGGQIAATAGTFNANLAAAGIAPEQIDIILISHFHPDHINGIKTKDDELYFPKAEIKVPQAEWDFWMDESLPGRAAPEIKGYVLNARRIFRNIAKDVTRFSPGAELAPGITAINASGHTPGHTAFSVASGNDSLLVLSDTSNHPKLFVRHPEWQPVLDMDGHDAVMTRRKLLDRAAADRMLVQGYHFPFPASGHIVRSGSGFELVPVEWRPL
ncbi:MAG TPA: MBL fold metallo-hydrolase [Xanthobacteraceae bacterium]|nr:MBL fold metallo-hydrolase [Xanthobacteraceae bacterium]